MTISTETGPRKRGADPLTVRIGPDGPVRKFKGRFGWTLRQLIAAGPKGVSTIERPAPRWSHYVHILRREGVSIETRTEPHSGDFPGHHGRYILATPLVVVSGGGV